MNLMAVTLVALALTAGLAHGQERGRVILYSDADFRGSSLVLKAGEEVRDFALRTYDDGVQANDSVSSIRIEGDVAIELYSNAAFRGGTLVLKDSLANLDDIPGPSRKRNWNDILSSVIVLEDREHRRRRVSPGAAVAERETARVELFTNANYQGPSIVVEVDNRLPDLSRLRFPERNFNDRVSSIRVVGRVRLLVYQHTDYRGEPMEITASVPNLDHFPGWNDSISSLRTETAPRRR